MSLSAKTICRKIDVKRLRGPTRCGKTIRIKTEDLVVMIRPLPCAKGLVMRLARDHRPQWGQFAAP